MTDANTNWTGQTFGFGSSARVNIQRIRLERTFAGPFGQPIDLNIRFGGDPNTATGDDDPQLFWRMFQEARARQQRRRPPAGAVRPRTPAHRVLGLDAGASPVEIRKAYRALARENHPDLGPPDEKDRRTRRMQEINRAYQELS